MSIAKLPLMRHWLLGVACAILIGGCSDSVGVSPAAAAKSPAAQSGTDPAAPTVSVTATPASIVVGAGATLSWSSTDATSCTASGAWSGAQGVSGTAQIAPTSVGVDTYTLTCSGSGGTAAGSAAVTVTAAPRAVAAVSPASLSFPSQAVGTPSAAQVVTLSNTGNAPLSGITISISGDFQQSDDCGATLAATASCSINVTFTPTGGGVRTGTLTVASDSAGGPVSAALIGTGASPIPPPVPTVSLAVTPPNITVGASATLTWTSTSAGSCTSSGAWSGPQPVSGTARLSPAAAGLYVYTLTCSGSGGTAAASASLNVAAAPMPTVSLAVTPPNITVGTSATLTWVSAHASSCTASGAWNGPQAVSGTARVTPAAAGLYAYTLTCSGSGGTAAASASLSVAAAPTAVATVSPAALTFPAQTVGVASSAQVVTLSNTGTAPLNGIAIAIGGDFHESNTCGAALAAAASCSISITFTPTAAGARTGTLTVASNSAGGAVNVALSGTGVTATPATPMPLISRGLPITASSAVYPAADADDADYGSVWQSDGVPASLTLDLSSVPAALRESIWLVWYNDTTYGYDHALVGQTAYNNAGAYTVSVNAAPGGGAAPTTGWVQLASLTGNTLHSYSHHLEFTGYNWVQLTFTISDGSPQNDDIAINLDVYGASGGVTDGWFMGGDSITANCMRHDVVIGEDENNPGATIVIPTPSFGAQVDAIVGNDTPLQENAGMPGYASGDMIAHFAGWLQHVPSRYVTINMGTNDAAGGVPPAVFYSNMQQLVEAVLTAGKVPIVPTIPYSTDPTHLANTPGLNAEIAALYTAYPAIVPGPDLWSFFSKNPQYLSSDNVHPNAQGCVAYRALWAQFAAASVYGK